MLKKKKIDNIYHEETIVLSDFNKLDSEAQYKLVEEKLNTMYENKVKVTRGYILKVIKLSMTKFDDELHLPNGLLVEKNDEQMVFSYKKHRNTLLLILMLGGILLVGAFSATYSAINYINEQKINIDIDNDGVAEINIDTDNDGNPNINIDYNGDRKPDVNVDYKDNHMSVFNIDTDNDGKADSNMVNDATADDTTCTINCDSDGNGWPDYNIDLDGDGKPDVYIDTNGDKTPDLNLDLNGDGTCDYMCDTDGDNMCDTYCSAANNSSGAIKNGGTSVVNGDPNSSVSSSNLFVYYEDYGELVVSGLFPDDQSGVEITYPEKTFTITNESNYIILYNLSWVVYKNTFTSTNFKYKMVGTNGGAQIDYTTLPLEDSVITTDVKIAPLTTQKYTITFDLFGTGAPQNYDQGKIFSGYVKVGN